MKVKRTLITNIEFEEKEYEHLEIEYDLLNQQYPNQIKNKKNDDFTISVTLELLRKLLNIDL